MSSSILTTVRWIRAPTGTRRVGLVKPAILYENIASSGPAKATMWILDPEKVRAFWALLTCGKVEEGNSRPWNTMSCRAISWKLDPGWPGLAMASRKMIGATAKILCVLLLNFILLILFFAERRISALPQPKRALRPVYWLEGQVK